MTTSIQVNGQTTPVRAEPETPLLWVLRGELKLTGTKFGCGIAQCGACTVQLGGQPLRSCSLPLSAVGEQPVLYQVIPRPPVAERRAGNDYFPAYAAVPVYLSFVTAGGGVADHRCLAGSFFVNMLIFLLT